MQPSTLLLFGLRYHYVVRHYAEGGVVINNFHIHLHLNNAKVMRKIVIVGLKIIQHRRWLKNLSNKLLLSYCNSVKPDIK